MLQEEFYLPNIQVVGVKMSSSQTKVEHTKAQSLVLLSAHIIVTLTVISLPLSCMINGAVVVLA